MKRIVAFIIALILICPLTAFANSAPSHWVGSDITGVVAFEKDCPVVVEKELLTFNIPAIPTQYMSDISKYQGNNFVAKYTLHNPTDMDITARVVFPFGKMGDYYGDGFITDSNFVSENYKVTVDGREIEKEIRYVLCPGEFDTDTMLDKVSDEFTGDKFFSPIQKVTKYVVSCGESNENKEVNIKWTAKNDGTFLYTADFNSGKFDDGAVDISADFYKDVVYYIIGEGENRPEVKIINKDSAGSESAEDITTSSRMTLEQFIAEYFGEFEKFEISRTDRANIAADMFRHISKEHRSRNFREGLSRFNIPADLMAMYSYEITIPAGGTVINTVTAPIFMDVNTTYRPDLCICNYLLSPAARWADFGSLEIVVYTPFYITESSVDNFEKTDTGYKSTLSKLPDGELSFTICESRQPEKESGYMDYLLIFFGMVAVAIIVAAFAIYRAYKLVKKMYK